MDKAFGKGIARCLFDVISPSFCGKPIKRSERHRFFSSFSSYWLLNTSFSGEIKLGKNLDYAEMS